MKLLIITNLFPNSKEPTRGMYNKQMISELAKLCELMVVAPIPWFPFKNFTKEGKKVAGISQLEEIDKIKVYHPRFLMTPKIGRFFYGFLFYLSISPLVKNIYKTFKFDLIFTLWAYPDGFGSVLLGKGLNKPVVIEALGTDINLYTKTLLRKNAILYALKKSKKVLVVSEALKNSLISLGVRAESIKVILNGVDTNSFKPLDKTQSRKTLKLPDDKNIVLFIGNLFPIKGIEYLIDAFSKIDYLNSLLVIVGDGYLKDKLIAQSKDLKISDKVYFIGKRPHTEIPLWLNSCDIFCLPSLNEGCPNVILEALACGKSIVATNVGGIPDVIKTGSEGILVAPKNSNLIAEGIKTIINNKTRSTASNESKYRRTWNNVAEEIYSEFERILKLNENYFS